MSSNIRKFGKAVGRSLKSLGQKSITLMDDGGEVWRRLEGLELAVQGYKGAREVIDYYRQMARTDDFARPVISDAAGRFLSTYKPVILHVQPQSGLILDIGAGCGLFSALAALVHKDKLVLAYEPDKALYKLSNDLLGAYAIDNLTIVNAAVVPDDWDTDFAYLDTYKDGIFRTVHKTGKVKVNATRISDLALPDGENIALLKIVCPGMFHEICTPLVSRCSTLVGEVWKADYAAADHPVLSTYLNTISTVMIRDAESGNIYSTHANQRPTRDKGAWSPNIIRKAPNPLISVIVPCYNIGDLIEPCVESILNSIDRPTEVLVINDGSTQAETLSSLSKIAKFPHTKVIDKPNGGCASARNLGLDIAAGEFVTLVDGDDFVEECFLPLLTEAIYLNASNISEIGFADYASQSGEVTDNREPYADRIAGRSLIGYETNMWELLRRQPAIWRRLYRLSWLKHNDLKFPERIKAYDDMEFQFLSLFINGGVSYANCRGYYYRKDRPGQDVKASDTRHFGTFQMLVNMENFLRSRRSPRDIFILFDLFAIDCLSWSYSLLHPQLLAPFRDAARTFLFGGKSYERVMNIYWELEQRFTSTSSSFALDFCADIPNREALEAVHRQSPHYTDHIYDYHHALEVTK